MASASGYPAPVGQAPLVAGAIQAAVRKTVPQTAPEADSPCEEQVADAEGTCAGDAAAGESLEVDDKVMAQLMQSLSNMEADYARTVAAGEKHAASLEPGGTLGGDDRDGAMAEDGSDASSSREDEENEGGGYAMIGSDGGGSNTDLDEVEESAPAPEAANTGWPAPQADDLDFQDFQGNHLESFADFGAANPLLPPPPNGLDLWASTPLTDTDVQFIKETMKLVEPKPPAWAQNLPDAQLQRMVRAALRST